MEKPIRVLYLHHGGIYGGSSKSLLQTILAFPSNSVKPYVVSPIGSTTKVYKQHNIELVEIVGMSIFDHSELGYYRRWRWLIILRELFYLPFSFWGIWKARKKWKDIDIIHVNEYLIIFPAIIAKILFDKPLILHARIRIQKNFGRYRQKLFQYFIEHYCDKTIAIDQDVSESLIHVKDHSIIHNGMTPPDLMKPIVSKPEEWPENYELVVGYVGLFYPNKGIWEYLKAAEISQKKGLNVAYVLVGEVPQNNGFACNIDFVRKMYGTVSIDTYREYVDQQQLKNVFFVPFQTDLTYVYNNIDVLCFPSHMEAAGRSIFEAAFYKKPSIVAITNPNNDTIINGVSGICIKPFRPQQIADAVEYYYCNKSEIVIMGNAAYELAIRKFDIRDTANKILEVYQKVLSNHSSFLP